MFIHPPMPLYYKGKFTIILYLQLYSQVFAEFLPIIDENVSLTNKKYTMQLLYGQLWHCNATFIIHLDNIGFMSYKGGNIVCF